MASTDWCELPNELLNLISKRIDEELDLIHFRSVCSKWRRYSVSNHHPNSTLKVPLLRLSYNLSNTITNTNTSPFCCLFKRTLFLIKPLRHGKPVRPWLIRVTQNSHGKTKLFHLLFNSVYSSHGFPRVLDFNKLSVLNLGTNFILDYGDINRHNYFFYNKKREKFLAIMCNGENPMVLGISEYFPHPMLFCYLNKFWKPISDMSTKYVDICVFKRRFYLVDNTGRTVTIESDSSVQLVDNPFIPGNRKLLVESEGELLLVNIYENLKTFDVFRLEEKNKKWVKLMSLGDRVLFFVNGCSFSASASDLCVAKGNYVVFIDDAYRICTYFRNYCLGRSQRLSVSEYLSLFSATEWIIKS